MTRLAGGERPAESPSGGQSKHTKGFTLSHRTVHEPQSNKGGGYQSRGVGFQHVFQTRRPCRRRVDRCGAWGSWCRCRRGSSVEFSSAAWSLDTPYCRPTCGTASEIYLMGAHDFRISPVNVGMKGEERRSDQTKSLQAVHLSTSRA